MAKMNVAEQIIDDQKGQPDGISSLDSSGINAQAPKPHATSHNYGESDAIDPANIGPNGVVELDGAGNNIADALADSPNPAKSYTDITTKISTDIGTHAGLPNAHHDKSHAHNGSDGSGTVAHASLTGQTANDHHAKSHTHNGDGSGTVSHNALVDVSTDQHHNKIHAHDGADGSGTVAHGSLTGVSADQHHSQAHGLDSTDHTGSLSESKVAFNITTGHKHNGTDSRKVGHADLDGVSADQHHAQAHALDGTDHTGSLAESKVDFDETAGHDHDGSDSKAVDHANLLNKGTNSHSTIDTHLGSTSNPHSVSKAQVGLGNVSDDAQLKRASGDFNSFTEKTGPVNDDIILIEDSADTYAKKKIKKSSLYASAFGGGASDTAVDSEASTTETSYQDRVNYTTGTLQAGRYRIGFQFLAKTGGAGQVGQYAIDVAGGESEAVECKDNYYQLQSGFVYYDLASAGTINIKLKYKSGGTNSTAYIMKARVEVWKVS